MIYWCYNQISNKITFETLGDKCELRIHETHPKNQTLQMSFNHYVSPYNINCDIKVTSNQIDDQMDRWMEWIRRN